MRVWVLGSGSGGNAVLVESGDARLLVDAGFAPRTLAGRLHAAAVPPQSIGSVVVTHEHRDHACGAAAGAARWGWSIFATHGTVAGAPDLRGRGVTTFAAGERVCVDGFQIDTARTSHDAAESVALVATATATGARVGVAYDLGTVTGTVRELLRGVDVLVLEANHDRDMLLDGPYPASVKARIDGRTGHLSNVDAAALARDCVHRGLRHIVLAHLSERCNAPQRARAVVDHALARARFRGRVTTARQSGVCGPLLVSAGPAATQLSLAL